MDDSSDTNTDNSIDQHFIEFVVKSLVGNPDAVVVERRIDEKGVLLELTVDPEDLGRVIGKRGATAQSLRTLLRALGTKNDARYNLKIVDNGEPRPERDESIDNSVPTSPVSQDSSTDNATSLASDLNLDEDDTDTHADSAAKKDDDRVSRTRRELQELDDLDV